MVFVKVQLVYNSQGATRSACPAHDTVLPARGNVGIEITNKEKLEDSQISGRLPNLLKTYSVYGAVSLIGHAAELTKPTGLRH